jgi:hypothetical protein
MPFRTSTPANSFNAICLEAEFLLQIGISDRIAILIADRHSRWGLHGFLRDKLAGVAFELLDSIDERRAMNCFGGVLRQGRRGSLLQQVVNMPQSDGPRLAGSSRIDGKRQHGFHGAKLHGALHFR